MILSSHRNFGSRIVYVQFFCIIFFFNFVKRKPSIIRKISIIYYLGKSRSIPKIGKKKWCWRKKQFWLHLTDITHQTQQYKNWNAKLVILMKPSFEMYSTKCLVSLDHPDIKKLTWIFNIISSICDFNWCKSGHSFK